MKEEVYALALEMVRTEPSDLIGFMKKWVKLQERITQTLPVIPVYTNIYFDFFSRELHDYRITEAVTWGEAVVKSYMSDIELLTEEQEAERQEQLKNMGLTPEKTAAPEAEAPTGGQEEGTPAPADADGDAEPEKNGGN